jgi:uncharacterized caspase-like protein
MLRIFAVLAVACMAVFNSAAANAETRVALVVGNGAYANAPKLTNPANDARDMTAALKAAGFDVIEAIDADKSKFDSALHGLADKLQTADVALFFYAGHGLQVGAENYLVPTDAKLERERDLEFEAVKLDFVLRQLEIEREGKTTIVILDACRDNPLARNLARSMGTRSTSIGRGLAAAAGGLGTFISYSTQPGNVALDGDGKNSPFAKALAKHVGVKGRNLQATMIAVRKDVVAATQGKQVPWDHSAMTGDFFFVPGDAAAAQGSVTAPAAGSSADVVALQERLRKLEDDAKTRANAPATPTLTADQMKLAELRARAASLDDLVKGLQRKLMDTRMEAGKAAGATEREKLMRDSMNIQMEWTRRGLDLKAIKEEIAALEGKKDVLPAKEVAAVSPSAALPVVKKPVVGKTSPNFEVTESVSLSGAEIRSFRAQNPDACREACDKDAACTGFQHGRKNPVMGTCRLFSKVDARSEDRSWVSGLKKKAAGE